MHFIRGLICYLKKTQNQNLFEPLSLFFQIVQSIAKWFYKPQKEKKEKTKFCYPEAYFAFIDVLFYVRFSF